MDNKKEIWISLPGHSGQYVISNHGRIKSYVKNKNGRILKGTVCKFGYLRHKIAGEKTKKYGHRLVVEAFFGKNSLKNKQVNHLNFNKKDNRLINLQICTQQENINHNILHGNSSKFKLKKEDVLAIRDGSKKGIKAKFYSDKYKVCIRTIRDVINGLSWSLID